MGKDPFKIKGISTVFKDSSKVGKNMEKELKKMSFNSIKGISSKENDAGKET